MRVHCPNCDRTCARVFEEDGAEYWEAHSKTIPYNKFRKRTWVHCPNYQRYVDGLTDNDECHVLYLVEPSDILEKVRDARANGRPQHMSTGAGFKLSPLR